MTHLHLQLPDDLRVKLERRAAEGGHSSVDAYVDALLRSDAEGEDPGAPDHLSFQSADQLEQMLLSRLDDKPGIEATSEFWADLKQKARQARPGRSNP
jgi:plasmid stability protein